jgi:hypothetical protein
MNTTCSSPAGLQQGKLQAMKKIAALIAATGIGATLFAQEFFVATEPASNMAKNSIGIRLGSRLMNMENSANLRNRLELETMFGLSKSLMVHGNLFMGDVYTGTYKAEGGSLYAKYRFLSQDGLHSHFRMAAFGKVSFINNPAVYQTSYKYVIDHGSGPVEHTGYNGHVAKDIDLDGNNSGWQVGVVATQLKHKLAVSSSLSFTNVRGNVNERLLPSQPRYGFNYTASAGYLLFPGQYESYKQTNVNLYAELLGTVLGENKGSYADFAPAVQFIFNSIAKVDIGARFTVWNNVHRMSNQSYILRLEYNFLNALNKKVKK